MASYEDEEENVRNLIVKEEMKARPDFEVKYKSKYAAKVKHEHQVVKREHPTMGYAKVHLNPPSQYLKKHTRPLLKPQVDHICLGRHSPRRAYPGKKDSEHESLRLPKASGRNFVKTNVENVMRMIPPERVENRIVDEPRGHTEKDMTPVFVFKKDFGKTPKYIFRRKHQIEQYLREQQHKSEPVDQPLPFVQISDYERADILQGLKNYWSEVQQDFCSLPLKIDTEPLKKRKSMLESKLKSLEKDIDLIERHENIYVMTNSDG